MILQNVLHESIVRRCELNNIKTIEELNDFEERYPDTESQVDALRIKLFSERISLMIKQDPEFDENDDTYKRLLESSIKRINDDNE